MSITYSLFDLPKKSDIPPREQHAHEVYFEENSSNKCLSIFPVIGLIASEGLLVGGGIIINVIGGPLGFAVGLSMLFIGVTMMLYSLSRDCGEDNISSEQDDFMSPYAP